MKGLRKLLGLSEDLGAELTPKLQMGIALARMRRADQTYAGTVPYAVVQQRRAANRRARTSRRTNRGAR